MSVASEGPDCRELQTYIWRRDFMGERGMEGNSVSELTG